MLVIAPSGDEIGGDELEPQASTTKADHRNQADTFIHIVSGALKLKEIVWTSRKAQPYDWMP
jgi:hypothetical protein